MGVAEAFKNQWTLIALGVIGILFLTSTFLINGTVKIALYLVFTIVSCVFTYVLSVNRSPIDISPIFFLMVLISVEYGFFYAVLFVITTTFLPVFFGGGDLEPGTFLFLGSFILICFLAQMFSGTAILTLGIGLMALNLVFAFFFQFMGENPGGFIYSLIHAVITIFYFAVLGEFLIKIIN